MGKRVGQALLVADFGVLANVFGFWSGRLDGRLLLARLGRVYVQLIIIPRRGVGLRVFF